MVIVLIRFPTGQNLLVLVRFGGGGNRGFSWFRFTASAVKSRRHN